MAPQVSTCARSWAIPCLNAPAAASALSGYAEYPLLPASLADCLPGLSVRPVPLSLPTFTTRLVWRDHNDEALLWLRQCLRATVQPQT
jgi:hypothetical protein